MTATTGWRDRDRWYALAIAAFAFVVRAAIDLHGRLAFGDFDEGVYFGTANALARGVVPYRDFVSVHPPFSTLLFTATTGPFTALWGPRVGFVATRVLAALAGAVTTWLLYRCALHLAGRRAAILTALLYATFAAAVFTEGRVLLDPFMIVFAVAGATVLLERRSMTTGVLAGVLFGLSISTKLTGGVFLVAAIGVALVLDRHRRRTLVMVASAAATFLLVSLPFMVLAGVRPWFDQVVMAQADRPTGNGLPGNIGSLTGRLSALVAWGPLGGRGMLPTIVLVLAALVGVVAIAWGVAHVWQRDLRAAFWTTTAVLAVAGLLVGPTFYTQYAVLAAVPMAVLLGGSFAAALDRLDRLGRARIATAATVAAAAVLVGWQTKVTVLVAPPVLPGGFSVLVRNLADEGCVVLDQPQIGFLSDIVPQAGIAEPLIDPFGELLELGRSESHTARDALWSEPAQRRLREALDECEWVALVDPPEAQATWSPSTLVWFVSSHELVGTYANYSVWRTPADRTG